HQISNLCKNSSASIAALYDTQVMFIADRKLMPKDCEIHRIAPQGNSTLIVEAFLPASFVYLLPPNTTARTVFKINQIILKLFSYEKSQIQEYWLSKELRLPTFANDVQQTSISSSVIALSLISLGGIFVAFLVGLGISFGVFIVEITTFQSVHCQNVHSCLTHFL
ncbi:hypothetical protein PENTCL1PPCAC_28000, partial [Pristionchus entomophagus]